MNTGHEARIDATIRARHADALEHLSPRTRAQLLLRRRAALSGVAARASSPAWRFAWPIAAALALGAVVIGLQFRALDAPAPQVAATTAPATNPDDAYTSLEENPDLYVWLASDGATLAME